MTELVVEVTTIRGGSVPGRVTGSSRVGLRTPEGLHQTSAREFTASLPESGNFDLTVTAGAAPDYWEDSGTCSVTIPSGPGRASVQVSGVTGGPITAATWEGRPPNLTLRVVMSVSKLRDATKDTPGMNFGSPRPAMRWDDEMMLNPSGKGAGVLRGSIVGFPADQSRFVVGMWRSNGIRVGIYLPRAGVTNPGHINIFFKPPKHDNWTAPGIFGDYMFWGEAGDLEKKQLVGQTEAGGKPYIIALPSPEDGRELTYNNSQAGVLELAEEIDVLVKRKILRQQGARPDVQRIALTCFSRGAMGVQTVMTGAGNNAFLDRLRGLWILDGHLDSGYAAFANAAHAWQRGGTDRTIRVYASESKFTEMMDGRGGTKSEGAGGSWQWRASSTVPGGFAPSSYTFMPAGLWTLWNAAQERAVTTHQLIPATCMSHALMTSGA
jgi:hypothetical protein